ncbi:MAG: sugar ABC transporter substrate-binding protein [Limnochordaceae bacterium]|nr:sugar ABC transporter substrate-binding protein [Limnochordaceae bacterium]
MSRWAVAVLSLILAVGGGLASTAAAATQEITVYLRGGIAVEYDWEKKVIAEFEKANPDIKVNIVTDAGSDYNSKLLTLWASGNAPDVWDHGGAVNTYLYQDWLLDLGPLIQRDATEVKPEDFFPGAWRAYRDGNKQWGMPFISVGSFFWYNVDALDRTGLEAPPWSWDDLSWTWSRMADYARKLTTRKPDGSIKEPGLALIHWSYLDIQYSWAFGGDWFDAATWRTGVARQPTFNTPENQQAYQAAIDLVYKDRSAVSAEFPANSNPPEMFVNGTAAMAVGEGPWLVMGRLNDIKFRWGMAPFPRGGKATHYTSMVYTDPWMISSQTKHKEAAWKFVKFITSPERMKDYAAIGNFVPARQSAAMDYLLTLSKASGFLKPQQVLESIAGAQKYGRESLDHVIVGWPDFFQEIQGRMPAIWGNTRSVATVLNEIQEATTKLIQKKFGSAATK